MWSGMAAILASLGFGILFNIRGKRLLIAALVGGVGGICYSVLTALNYSAVMALFWASLAISILSEIASRWMKSPVTTFLICALIPLVPGGSMYYTMLEVVQNNYQQALEIGFATLIQAGAIVIACTLVASVTRILTKRKRRKAVTL